MANSVPEKIPIGKALLDNITFDECLEIVKKSADENEKIYIVTANVDHIVKLEEDAVFVSAYNKANLAVADGLFLVWSSKLLHTSLKERITGSDLFPAICKIANDNGYNIFLLGSQPGVAEKAAEVLKKKLSNLNVVGTYSPPFGFELDLEENKKIINIINDAKTNFLFVALGAPKQEKWIYNNFDALHINMAIGVGASFDFISGRVRRSPVFLQKMGLEWAWRMAQDPQRLIKRYLVEDIVYFKILFNQLLNKKKR